MGCAAEAGRPTWLPQRSAAGLLDRGLRRPFLRGRGRLGCRLGLLGRGPLGGAVVDSGRFDWKKTPGKFPTITEPDPSYHGAVYTQAVGDALAYVIKARVQLLREIG